MAKKADLESEFRTCTAGCQDAARAEERADFADALNLAESCLPLLRSYVAYLRRYQRVEAPGLPPLELIFRLAPPMFSNRSLNAVQAWFADAGRTERKAYPDLLTRLDEARQRLAVATRLWPAWRITPPGAVTAEAGHMLDVWVRYGAVSPIPNDADFIRLVTYPGRASVGKCTRCGTRGGAVGRTLVAAGLRPMRGGVRIRHRGPGLLKGNP